ncbi:MAG: hypothetical protein IJE00_00055 [Clostridia bacterium]|nr:hypothetical protein [Clostridia bacterium]
MDMDMKKKPVESRALEVGDRLKQTIIRLSPEMHHRLKSELSLDGRSMVDFFTDAAKAYLKDKKQYTDDVTRILHR